MAAGEKGARGWSRSFFDGAIALHGVGETQLQDIFCRPLGPESYRVMNLSRHFVEMSFR